MAQPSGPSSAHELDTRLLRFRTRPGSEDAGRLAADLLSADRAVDAIDVTGSGLRNAPDDLTLLVLDGRAHYAAGDLLRAQAALLKAARIAPAQKDPFRWLGEVLLKRGDPERALKVLERARAIDPDDRHVQGLYGRAERLARIAGNDGTAELEATPAGAAHGIASASLFEEDEETRPLGGDEGDEDSPTSLMDRGDVDKALESLRRPAAPPVTRALEPFARGQTPGSRDGRAEPAPERARRATAPFAGGPPADPPARPMPTAALPPTTAPAALPSRGRAAAPLSASAPASARPSPDGRAPANPAPASAAVGTPSPARAEPRSAPNDPFAAPQPPRHPGDPVRATFDAPRTSRPPPAARPGSARPMPIGAEPRPAASARSRASLEAEDAELVYDEEVLPPPPPDVPAGERAGAPEDVDEILGLLKAQGIFEPPAGDVAAWAPRKEAVASGTRIGVWMGAAWVLAIGIGAGVWYGWQAWVAQRHAGAARLVAQAREEAHIGDHQRLVDAERHLREARELDPNDTTNPSVLLFVQAQQALEDGAFEVGYLRPTIARAERMHSDPRWLDAARAVVAAGEGDRDSARAALGRAIEGEGASDAGLLYVVGRVEQRLGAESGVDHLQAAVERDPQLAAPAIALAEARHDEGRPEDALALLDAVLAREAQNLRAQLWRAFLTADDRDPGDATAALEPLEARLEHGAPTDRVLLALTRARLARRQGQHQAAAEAVDTALEAGAQEPRLLALMARAAVTAGRLLQAEHAATAAVRASPSNADFRKLLASIQIERRTGERALATLAQLPADDPEVVLMTGRAALLLGTDEALSGAAAALDRFVEAHEDAGLEVRALRIRVALHTADGASMLAAARTLARENPGDPIASMTLGEAALRAREGATAEQALAQVVQASPDDPEGHYLLGRARRMQGDPEGARRSLERAIALRPEHADAKVALGGLLLDTGDNEAAERLYGELARAAGSASGMPLALAGRLGRVEALIALGRLDDATVQMEGVRDGEREAAAARLTAARLALARGRSGDAIRELRALLPSEESGQQASPAVLALYGDALLAAGQVDPSAAAYEQALAQDADLPEALLGRAELYVRGTAGGEAAPLLGRARAALRVRIRPPALRARMLMLEGRVAMLARDMESARARLREATAIAGVPAEAFFHLGEALAGENAPEARAAYERYLQIAPDGPFAGRARRAIR